MLFDAGGQQLNFTAPETHWNEVQVSQLVEIARSFSYKLNMGNYESRDFFCSQKAECRIQDAEAVSDRVYQFCKSQVLKAVAEYKAELEAQAKAGRDYVNERKAELDRTRLATARGGQS